MPRHIKARQRWLKHYDESLAEYCCRIALQHWSLTLLNKDFKHWLWNVIQSSREHEDATPKAAKAISVLNAMGASFMLLLHLWHSS
jgi:hypothetical protein